MKANRFTRVVSFAVSGALVLFGAMPSTAIADETLDQLQAQAEAARVTYNELGYAIAQLGEELNDTYYQLDQTRSNIDDLGVQIEATQAKLGEAKTALANRVSAHYKAGNESLLSLFMGCSTFDELVSAVYYADKLVEQDEACINNVKTVQAELDAEQADLRALEELQSALADQEETQLANLAAQQDAQGAYIAQLDSQVRARMEFLQAQELERQRAEAEALAAAQMAAIAEAEAAEQAAPGDNGESSYEYSGSASSTTSTSSSSSGSSSSGSSSSSSSSSTSGSARSAILAAAYSQVGVPYVYGSSDPGVSFDCSGFTSWCYSQAGVNIPHSSVAQSGMASSSDINNLQAGDLVFWIGNVGGSQSGSHVAIYAGDGKIIHANGTSVAVDDLSNWGDYTSVGSVI